MDNEVKRPNIFWNVFFAVWLALTLFGACTGYIVSEMRYTIEGTSGDQTYCKKMNIFGAVMEQGPCK